MILGQALGINDEATNIAYNYSLHDNYPNPFNPETHIRFELGAQENVKLMIYDALGVKLERWSMVSHLAQVFMLSIGTEEIIKVRLFLQAYIFIG